MSDWNPGAKYRTLLDRIQKILSTGEKRTVRDVYYALESRGYDYEYRPVKRAVKKGRRAGYIDPALIFDAARPVTNSANEGFSSPDEFLDTYVQSIEEQYSENFWDEQPEYVEVWLEKQSLASVFKPICDEWNVRLECTRGDWSDAKIYDAAQRLIRRMSPDKDVTILYFGDYNPSGFHAPVAIQHTLGHYGLPLDRDIPEGAPDHAADKLYFDISPPWYPIEYEDGGTLTFERIAMNTEHVERFELPINPSPSKSDKDKKLRDRFMRYVSDGRDVNIELNALKEYHRDFLTDLIEDAIREHVNIDAKERVEKRVRNRRQEIRASVTVDRSGIDSGGEQA